MFAPSNALEYSIPSSEMILLKKLLRVIQDPEFSNLDITSWLSLQHTASSSVQPYTVPTFAPIWNLSTEWIINLRWGF